MTSFYKKIDILEYIFSNYELTEWYCLGDDNNAKYNYLVFIRNKNTDDIMKVKWGCNQPAGIIKLIDVLNGLAFDISVLDNDDYDNFDLDYNEIRRLKKITRREKRALMRLIDGYDIDDFINNIRDLEL